MSDLAFCTAVATGVARGATGLRCKSCAFRLTIQVRCRPPRSRASPRRLCLQKPQPLPRPAQSLPHLQRARSQLKCRPTPHLFRSRRVPPRFGITHAFTCTSQTAKPVAGQGDAELESLVERTAPSHFAVSVVRKWKTVGFSIEALEEAASFSQGAIARPHAREPSTGRPGGKKSLRSKKGNCSTNVF